MLGVYRFVERGPDSLRLAGRLFVLHWAAALVTCAIGCGAKTPRIANTNTTDEPPEKLSSYGLFKGNGSSQEPVDGVIPYDVNTPLFSDFAHKLRFVRLPPGTSAHYRDPAPLEFPVGAVLVKTFAYPIDERDPSKGRRLVETRLLLNEPEGWKGLPYVWNDEQTEATLRIVGADQEIHWIDASGHQQQVKYLVPNTNQCLGCHENRKIMRRSGRRLAISIVLTITRKGP